MQRLPGSHRALRAGVLASRAHVSGWAGDCRHRVSIKATRGSHSRNVALRSRLSAAAHVRTLASLLPDLGIPTAKQVRIARSPRTAAQRRMPTQAVTRISEVWRARPACLIHACEFRCAGRARVSPAALNRSLPRWITETLVLVETRTARRRWVRTATDASIASLPFLASTATAAAVRGIRRGICFAAGRPVVVAIGEAVLALELARPRDALGGTGVRVGGAAATAAATVVHVAAEVDALPSAATGPWAALVRR
jgi:hypothetical protein